MTLRGEIPAMSQCDDAFYSRCVQGPDGEILIEYTLARNDVQYRRATSQEEARYTRLKMLQLAGKFEPMTIVWA